MSESGDVLAMGHGAPWPEESPFGIQSKKLAMWLFIMADAATFGAILFGYGYLRVGKPGLDPAVRLHPDASSTGWS